MEILSPLPFRVSALLSLQRALWDGVSPSLRGVAVAVTAAAIRGRMIYDHVPTEDEVESCSLVETYVVADMAPEVVVDLTAVTVTPPEPRNLLPGEEWVYLRKEEPPVAGKVREPLILIGYWRGPGAPNFPDPRDFVDPAWGSHERRHVQRYLEGGMVARVYRGQSSCRFCGEHVGHREQTDGTYLWPEGLAHYVAEHDVRLPAEFVHHALGTAHDMEHRDVDSTWWTALVGPGPVKYPVTVRAVGGGRPVPVVVETPAGLLRGVFMATVPAVEDVVNVELEVPGEISWDEVTIGDRATAHPAGTGRQWLRGVVEAVEPDGVMVLRSGVGLTMLEMTGDAPDGVVGTKIAVPVHELRFHPTGV
ncbi:hypothetical protein [Myceligenerans indicum]|uniref:Uncharacterized protein n=1 Tax=Myceligenerans indicum TaxID=2593663 RepID=A0ABS1LIZ6_9MICO|nr:hypothetical protein [Myceligenerans indicum]MBL0886211.1 hypothetical protein [Myceligenerans indicum]